MSNSGSDHRNIPIGKQVRQFGEICTWESPAGNQGYGMTSRYRNAAERPPEGDFSRLLEYARVLGHNRWRVLVPTAIGLLIGVAAAQYQTPMYEARAALEIQGTNEGLRETWTSAATTPYAQNQARLLQSDTLKERTRRRVLAAEQLQATAPIGSKQRRLFGILSPRELTVEEAVDAAAGNLQVVSSAQHMVLEVSTSSPDPHIAAAFVNALLSEYSDWNIEGRWEAYQRTSEWLVNAQQVLSGNLRAAEKTLLNYAARTNLVLLPSGDAEASSMPTVASERLRALQTDLSQAQADRILKESQMKIAVASPAGSEASLTEGSVTDHYERELADLRRQYAELNAELTPEHYRVKRVKAQMDSLEQGLKKERESQVQKLRLAYETALHREANLRQEYMSQVGTVSSESEKLIQYDILKRELEVNRQLHDAILKRSEEASVDSALRATNSRVVDQARPAGDPFEPNEPLYAGIGLLSGCLAGVGLVFARRSTDNTLHAPGQASALLDMRELGAIPAATQDRALRLHTRRPGVGLTSPRLGAGVGLPVWTSRSSATAEAFRGALISILSRGGSWEGITSLAITSPGPAEGKTSVAANLAVAFTEIRRKTLLIDADLRRPRIHEVFDLANQAGLAAALGATVNVSVKDLVQKTNVPGLSVLTAGVAPPDRTAALLYSTRLEELLAELKSEYDVVLIDTAPVLTFSDARLISRCVDGVVLVLRAGETTCDAASASLQALREHGAPVLGTILNGWNPNFEDASRYYMAAPK